MKIYLIDLWLKILLIGISLGFIGFFIGYVIDKYYVMFENKVYYLIWEKEKRKR